MQKTRKEILEYGEEVERYKICMRDIKSRFLKIKRYLESLTSYEEIDFDAEFICLQFRSIIELIVLSNLAAYQSFYTKGFEQLQKEWRPLKILKFIESINPNYYPIPVSIEESSNFNIENPTFTLNELQTGFLTKDDFIGIYDECSKYLHAQNPFAQKRDFYSISTIFLEWWHKIEMLLNAHVISLKNVDKKFLVVLDFANNALENKNEITILFLTDKIF